MVVRPGVSLKQCQEVKRKREPSLKNKLKGKRNESTFRFKSEIGKENLIGNQYSPSFPELKNFEYVATVTCDHE